MVAISPTPSRSVFIGQTVANKYRLTRVLSESDADMVFAAQALNGTSVVVKVAASHDPALLERWRAAAKLVHPNLLRIVDCGEEVLAGANAFYLVTESAEDSLAHVLTARALSSDEMFSVLHPTLDALAYLHAHGKVHGALVPAHVQAIGETLKLDSETVRAGDSAEDMRALGALLIESLTQKKLVGDGLMQTQILRKPFAEIARGCLSGKWAVRDVRHALEPEKPEPSAAAALLQDDEPEEHRSYRLPIIAAVIAAVLVLTVYTLMRNRGTSSEARPVPPVAVTTAPTTSDAAPAVSAPIQAPPVAVHQPLPEPMGRAQRSIHGTIKVRLRANVDERGNVTSMQTVHAGSSRYFLRLADSTLRTWTFEPGRAGERVVEFRFRHSGPSAQIVR